MNESRKRFAASEVSFFSSPLHDRKERVMKCQSKWYRSAIYGVALLAGLGMSSTSVFAGGTAPGTPISNTATLSYQIGAVAQTPVPATSPAFLVDRLVRVTVTESNSLPTQVVPGATTQVTTYSVSNTGNLAQAYILAAADLPNGATVTLGILRTDNLALVVAPACAAFVENGLDASGYQSSGVNQDTAVAISTLAPDASATVYVVCDVPLTATNGQIAIVSLTAITAETPGCAGTGVGCVPTVESPRGVADDPNAIEIVFGDAAGSEATDIVRDGEHSARDAYLVSAAVISISKTFVLLCDPVNFNVNPRSIPGAYVQYSITISNGAGAATAILGDVTDVLNTNFNFDPDLKLATGAACPSVAESAPGFGFKMTCAGGSRACNTPVYFNAAPISITGSNITAALGTALPVEGVTYAAGELKAGESVVVKYNAIVK